ncbi:hypothetical protein SERLA73DRAFT_178747 [Serpula lacrymans var. lacrymans S7.3]|uniref:Alpha/beta hydrolase fold-3 domain-containing protein n=2 Tax=Serpula lacrymans var. lacrymans TaxID=341189 RepID=F8PSU6_SERL3|nr:uncharacterized protein SERLADRAFT_463359 [Serpula lacrymans var. lacrymans S7.9]EGO00804.1 hypothetical protein SERLA73DRAFT_178747 [Serpula lacrymans var. lacrymans S7.3]EGO26364.1 hypothetical protein SERLADRAFT_463359 [Serpula lacrymans var. lacrymans S7.9]
MVHELQHQPARGLYLAYQIISTLFFRLPFWILVSIPRPWRPRPSWSLKRCLWVNLIRHVSQIFYKTGPIFISPSHLEIQTGPGIRGVWVEVATASRLITGDLATWASMANVKSVRIPGYWLDREGSEVKVGERLQLNPGEKVLYRLHGGSYIQLSAHSDDPTAAIARDLLKQCCSLACAFSIEYRLSASDPHPARNPFPAALIDALAGYSYLVNSIGIPASAIIIEGDSSGGNLALALARYLVEYHDSPDVDLPPPPGGLILFSPRTDMSCSHETPDSSALNFFKSDILGPEIIGRSTYPKNSYLGPHGFDAAMYNPYISPASRYIKEISFKGFPRTFLVAGGAELFRDQLRTLRNDMARDMGEGDDTGQISYYEAPDGIHVYAMFAWHEPERSDTLSAIAQWIDWEKDNLNAQIV